MQQVLGSRGRGLAARSQGEGAAAGRGRERPHKALTATDSTTPPLPQPLPSPSTPRNPGHPEMARGPPPTHCHQLLLPISGFDFGLFRAPHGYLHWHSLGAGLTLLGARSGQGSGSATLLCIFTHTHQMWLQAPLSYLSFLVLRTLSLTGGI